MEILEYNHEYLEITNHNRLGLWGSLFATPFLLIGIGMVAMTAKVVTLKCQRQTSLPEINCQRNIVGILGTEKTQFSGHLQKAEVVKASGTGVVLWMDTKRIELTPYRAFVTDRQFVTADRINAFLADPQQNTLQVEQDDRWSNLPWSGNFLLSSVLMSIASLAIPRHLICKFDKINSQAILYKKYWFLGIRQKILPLSEIKDLQVHKLFFYVNHQAVFNLKLVLTSGKKISLSIPTRKLAEYQEIADQTNRFLAKT